jgi:hypothetical protein
MSSAQAQKKAGEGNGAGMTGGGARPFIGDGGAPRRQQRVVTAGVKAFMPLIGRRGLRRGS